MGGRDIPLGKDVGCTDQYTPSLLFPISREEARRAIGVSTPLPFRGEDVWCC